jgi:hypothetical protein
MAATATARSTAPAKRAPARRPAPRTAPRRSRQHTPSGGFVVPAALRTAGAVGGIADSGVVVRLTRGRLWIGILAALLVGIVALNVVALSFSASSSGAARQGDALKRQNSALRAQIAELTASVEVQQTAGRLGLYVPNPGQVGYLRPTADDAVEAAKRLRAGELSTTQYVAPAEAIATEAPVAPVAEETAVAATPSETAPVEAAAPVAAEPAPVAEATPASATPAVSGGGVSSP